MEEKSYFDGGLLSYIGWIILGSFITTCTFGICFPWAICMFYGWNLPNILLFLTFIIFNCIYCVIFYNYLTKIAMVFSNLI